MSYQFDKTTMSRMPYGMAEYIQENPQLFVKPAKPKTNKKKKKKKK